MTRVTFYDVGSSVFTTGFRVLGIDLQAIGHEHIPATGPVILASNHVGYLDFCFVMLAPPKPRRPVRFLARHEFFERRFVGSALRRLGQIPVDVHGDPLAAMDAASAALSAGEVVGLHPEGTISPSFVPRRAKSGAIRLAWASQAPVIPAAVWGSQRLLTKWRKPRLTRGVPVLVRYGEPYHPEPGVPAALRARELMDRITALLELNWRDYPTRPRPDDDWWVPAHLGGSAPTPAEAEERLRRQVDERRTRRASQR